MVRIYFTSFHEKLSSICFDRHLFTLPDPMKQQVLRYRRWEDQHACLFGKLLLQQCVADAQGKDLRDVRYTKYHKPFIDGGASFSISHSGKYVLCGISTVYQIGLDIEEIREDLDFHEFRSQFNSEEWHKIMNSIEPLRAFYAVWASKEAAIKADGRGLNIIGKSHLSSGRVVIDQMGWIITRLDIDRKYEIALATCKPLAEPITLKRMSFHMQT